MAPMPSTLKSLCLLGTAFLFPIAVQAGCNADNCARAVTGTRLGGGRAASARADCSSFLATTVLADAVTITVTEVSSTSSGSQTSSPSIPSYASKCGGSSRYSSACSCWGVTGAQVTITPTSTVVATSTPEPSGPTVPYEPKIPDSYDDCAYNPESAGPFQVADPNTGLPIIKNGTLAKVVEDVPEGFTPPTFKASKPTGAAKGLFDLVLEADGKKFYLAVYKSGKVGFVTTSSEGQDYVPEGGDSYVTSAFTFSCEGRLTAGILGIKEFFFLITDDKRVVVSTVRPNKLRRDIPVPEGFFIIPESRPTVPSRQRCFPGQTPVSKGITPSTNGCGPEGGFHGIDLVPDFNFGSCCDSHDRCFGDCPQTFSSCNNDFLSCALGRCIADFKFVPPLALACSNIAVFFYGAISVGGGSAFRAATEKHCECKCDDPALTACDDKCVDTNNDPDNCGQCFFHCPSGSCTNGACSFDSCTGSVCGAFGSCGPGGSCVCGSTSSGQGFCVNGNTPCAGLSGCGSNTDCPLGSVCIIGSCCSRNVCVATDFCGGFIEKRDLIGATLADPGLGFSDNGTSEAV